MSDPNQPRNPQDPNEPGGPRDPHTRGRGPIDSGNPYTRWIIAAAAVIILILAVFMFTGTDTVEEPPPEAGIEDPAAPETGMTPEPEAEPADPEAMPADPEAEPAPEDNGEEIELDQNAN